MNRDLTLTTSYDVLKTSTVERCNLLWACHFDSQPISESVSPTHLSAFMSIVKLRVFLVIPKATGSLVDETVIWKYQLCCQQKKKNTSLKIIAKMFGIQ